MILTIGSLLLWCLTATTSWNFARAQEGGATNVYPCNAVIGTITVADIKERMEYFLSRVYLDPANLKTVIPYFESPLEYDVQVSKVCGSCADFDDDAAVGEYCDPNSYSYDATYSTLVMHPVDPATNQPLAAELPGAVTFMATRSEKNQAPTVNFTLDFQAQVEKPDPYAYHEEDIPHSLTHADLIRPLISSSAGAISVYADQIGTGESQDYDRTYFTRYGAEKLAVIPWLAAQQYTKRSTKGCTVLLDETVAMGYSYGGYNAMYGTLALQAIGVQVKQMFVQSAVTNVQLLAFGLMGRFFNPETHFSPISSMLLAAYSNERATFLPNAGTNQTLSSPESAPFWVDTIMAQDLPWNQVSDLLPTENEIAYINPNYLAAIGAASPADSLPCNPDIMTDDIRLLCQALDESNPLGLFYAGAFDDIPLQTCHSHNDTVAPYLFTQILPSDAPNIQPYDPPMSILLPMADHATGHHICYGAFSQYYTDNPVTMKTIDKDLDGNLCKVMRAETNGSKDDEEVMSSSLANGLSIWISLGLVFKVLVLLDLPF